MNTKNLFRIVLACFFVLVILIYADTAAQPKPRSVPTAPNPCQCPALTKVITFYENDTIPAGTGISSGVYKNVDGYRFINITVEFEQVTADEKPVSLGVMFAYSASGNLGSRRYFNFEQNFTEDADPQMITLSGKNSWHGSPPNKSSYTARLPIMGPYVQVFPFNLEPKVRRITIKAYLST